MIQYQALIYDTFINDLHSESHFHISTFSIRHDGDGGGKQGCTGRTFAGNPT